MSLTTIEEIFSGIENVEDKINELDNEIIKLVQKAFMDALRENTTMPEVQIRTAWLRYNACNDNMRI